MLKALYDQVMASPTGKDGRTTCILRDRWRRREYPAPQSAPGSYSLVNHVRIPQKVVSVLVVKVDLVKSRLYGAALTCGEPEGRSPNDFASHDFGNL